MFNNTLQQKIMRRVYYAFVLRLGTHRVTVGLIFSVASLYLLGKLVFVSRVVDGFMNVQVKDLIPHAVKVLTNADVLTLAVFIVCLMSFVYVGLNLASLRQHRTPRMQIA